MLRMLGVPVDGPSLMLGDNNSMVLNTSVQSSVLKKKHHACAYNQVREAIAGGIVNFVHIRSETNFADMLSKPLATFFPRKLEKSHIRNNEIPEKHTFTNSQHT